VLAGRKRSVGAINERFQFSNQKLSVLSAAIGSAAAFVSRGAEFLVPETPRVGDADEDHWLDFTILNEPFRRSADIPRHARIRCCRIEQVLAVLEVKNGKALRRLFVVGRRQPNCDVASATKILCGKPNKLMQVFPYRSVARRGAFKG